MPTTQKSPQKHTKATQKVGGSAKKPVMKAMEGGSAKKPVTKVVGGGSAAPSKSKTTRGESAKGGGIKIYQETKERSEDNRKLIMHLYNLIGSLVDELNETVFKNYNKEYKFRVEEYSPKKDTRGNLIIPVYNSEYFEKLITEKIDNTEFIRSIKKLNLISRPSVDEYLKEDYQLTKSDLAEAIFKEADMGRLYVDPHYRQNILK